MDNKIHQWKTGNGINAVSRFWTCKCLFGVKEKCSVRVNYIMFDVTDHCNFRCKHCYKNQPDDYTDINVDNIILFLNEFKSRGQRPSIVISGGEPLLYKDLYKLLDYVCDGRSVRVNTNGLLLQKKLDKLLNYKNLSLQVSLDGYDDETFFEIRNNHYFDRIVENTRTAFQAGLNVYFRATLTNKTISHYEKFIALSDKTEVPLVIRPMYNTGEVEQQKLKIGFEELCEWQQNVIKRGQIKYTGGKDLISESACPLLHKDLIYSTLTVDNRGNVYPCQLLRSRQFYKGNILNDTYDMIFSHGEEMVSSLKKIINSESCQKCGFRNNFGNGTCVSACYLGNKKCVKGKIMGEER